MTGMKICTIAYDGETPTYLPHQKPSRLKIAMIEAEQINAIIEAVTVIALRNNIDLGMLSWDNKIDRNPVSLRLFCDETMENYLRFGLPDEFLIEVDPALCNRVIHRAAHPQHRP
jgi:hypothetical protein